VKPSRRIYLAVALSLLVHALLLGTPVRAPLTLSQATSAAPPLSVRLVDPVPQPEPTVEPARPQPEVAPPPKPRAPPPLMRRPEPAKPDKPALPEPQPAPPEPMPVKPAPEPPDMLAMIEARRAQRRALEAQRPQVPTAPPETDAATRNLQTLTGRDGVSGVFSILRMGTRTGEFAFNGWKPDARSRWREVYEVDAGVGGNLELALVRRMIDLIRDHYTGDFNWESRRLGRVVVLSARPEDRAELEDFLVREFFGQPVVNPRRAP
jgi:hypothetical protein